MDDDHVPLHLPECHVGRAVGRLHHLCDRHGRIHHGGPSEPAAFGPYLQLVGANKAYEPSALAIIAFAITWLSMGLLQLVSRFSKMAPSKA